MGTYLVGRKDTLLYTGTPHIVCRAHHTPKVATGNMRHSSSYTQPLMVQCTRRYFRDILTGVQPQQLSGSFHNSLHRRPDPRVSSRTLSGKSSPVIVYTSPFSRHDTLECLLPVFQIIHKFTDSSIGSSFSVTPTFALSCYIGGKGSAYPHSGLKVVREGNRSVHSHAIQWQGLKGVLSVR